MAIHRVRRPRSALTPRDPNFFTPANLSPFSALLFAHNSEQVLTPDGSSALADYLSNGGAFVGVHSASACLFNDSTYAKAIGAYFDYHPRLQQAVG